MQSEGYPFEIFIQDVLDRLPETNAQAVKTYFEGLYVSHQEKSRSGAEHKFKGGLADQSREVVKYHTATHLLHWALREVLGPEVQQQGSNITGERLRFDFTYSGKLTPEQIPAVETLVNDVIGKGLPVGFEILAREEAEQSGALHFFGEKYGEQVKVYFVGTSLESAVSKEFCGGPHVENTSDLEKIEIYKQEGIGKGKIRVYARFVS
jgi:alanyl-tRNA synthetase